MPSELERARYEDLLWGRAKAFERKIERLLLEESVRFSSFEAGVCQSREVHDWRLLNVSGVEFAEILAWRDREVREVVRVEREAAVEKLAVQHRLCLEFLGLMAERDTMGQVGLTFFQEGSSEFERCQRAVFNCQGSSNPSATDGPSLRDGMAMRLLNAVRITNGYSLDRFHAAEKVARKEAEARGLPAPEVRGLFMPLALDEIAHSIVYGVGNEPADAADLGRIFPRLEFMKKGETQAQPYLRPVDPDVAHTAAAMHTRTFLEGPGWSPCVGPWTLSRYSRHDVHSRHAPVTRAALDEAYRALIRGGAFSAPPKAVAPQHKRQHKEVPSGRSRPAPRGSAVRLSARESASGGSPADSRLMSLEGRGDVNCPCYVLLSRVLIEPPPSGGKPRSASEVHVLDKSAHIHPEFLFQLDFVPPELSAQGGDSPSPPAVNESKGAPAAGTPHPPAPPAGGALGGAIPSKEETVRLKGAVNEVHRAFESHLSALQDATLRSELVECHLGTDAAQKAMARLRADLSHEASRTADIAMQVRFLAKSLGRKVAKP